MKGKVRFLILFLIFAGIIPVKTTAQQQSVLRVVVYSGEDGNPLLGANVLLYKPDRRQANNRFRHGGSTNSNGFVGFRGIIPGEYQLKVTFVGFQSYNELITLKANDIEVIEVTLTPQVGELEELMVEAERNIEIGEVGLIKISPEEIARIPTPGTGGDLASYLQTLPGVVMTGNRGGQLFIRGGTPVQNLVLVNNMPVIKPFHISNLFSAFPSNIIQSADVYAGGFGAKYLGATSAVIDVNLRAGNMREFSTKAGISSHLVSLKLEGPIEYDNKSFMIMARKSIIDQTDTYLTTRPVPIDFYDITASYTFRPGNYSCSITGLRTYDQGQINPARDISLTWSNTVIGGTCLGYKETYKFPLEITLGYSAFSNSESSPNRQLTSSNFSQIFLKIENPRQFFGLPTLYNLEVYIQFYNTTLTERFQSLDSFDFLVQALTKLSGSLIWEVNSDITIKPSLGAQLTLSNISIEPRLRISYHPKVNYEISLAFGKYNQAMIGITDQRDAGTTFTVLKPNNRIPMSEALHGLIGFNANWKEFEVNLGGYVIKRKNISVAKWTPIAGVEIETALANGLSYGFDASIIYNKNPFYLSLSYGWARTKYEAKTEALGAWARGKVFSYFPPHDRRHKFNAIGSVSFAGFTTNLSWSYGSGRPFTQVFGFDLALNFPFIPIPAERPTTERGTARTLFSRPYGARLPSVHQLNVSIEKEFELSNHFLLNAEIGVINAYGRENIFYFDSNTLQRVNQTPFLPYFTLSAEFNS